MPDDMPFVLKEVSHINPEGNFKGKTFETPKGNVFRVRLVKQETPHSQMLSIETQLVIKGKGKNKEDTVGRIFQPLTVGLPNGREYIDSQIAQAVKNAEIQLESQAEVQDYLKSWNVDLDAEGARSTAAIGPGGLSIANQAPMAIQYIDAEGANPVAGQGEGPEGS